MRAARVTGIAFNVYSKKSDCTLGFGATCEGSAKLRPGSQIWHLAKFREHDSILRSVTTSKLFMLSLQRSKPRSLNRQNAQFNHNFRPFIVCGLSPLGLSGTVKIHLVPAGFSGALLDRLLESDSRA